MVLLAAQIGAMASPIMTPAPAPACRSSLPGGSTAESGGGSPGRRHSSISRLFKKQRTLNAMGSPLMPTAAPSGQGRGFIERNFSFAQTKLSVSQWRAAAAISRALYKLKGVRHRRERLEPAASRVLPVRFAIQLVHSQRRRLFFSELTLFAVFVVSLLVLLLLHSARIHEDWERAELLSGKLGLSTTNPLLPFNSIKDSNAMWDWVQHAFVPSVFDLPRRAGELGELQVRLLRALPSAAEDVSLGMYTWDTRDYVDGWSVPATGGSATSACDAPGEDGRPRWVGGTGCFQYRDDEFAFLRNSWLKPWGYDDYGYGGYKKLIPTSNASCADAVVRALAAHGYVDDHAVAVSFGLNVHSSRANQLTTVRVLFEFGQSGNVANSALVSSVKARMYSLGSAHDMLLLALDVLVYALICYYTAVMVGEWAHLGRLWFYDAFNLCELAISVTSIFILVYYVRFLREHKRATVADTWRTTDISALPFTYDSLFSTMAVTLMLCILKCFKYLKLEPSMMRVFDLVYEAAADLTSFLLLFGLLVVAFAMVGHFSFGRSVGAFHSPGESIITCMRFTIGDVDYDSIKQANPTLAPIFVLTWALVSVLVLVNVFIAILNEYYMEVKQRDKNEVKHRADSTTSALLGSKGAAGRMLRAPVSSVVGDRVWSVIVRLAVLKLRVHPRQDPVSVAEQDTVLVLNQFGEPAGLHRANRDVLTRRSADGRIVRVQLKRVVVSHNITRWVKEADELRVSGARRRVPRALARTSRARVPRADALRSCPRRVRRHACRAPRGRSAPVRMRVHGNVPRGGGWRGAHLARAPVARGQRGHAALRHEHRAAAVPIAARGPHPDRPACAHPLAAHRARPRRTAGGDDDAAARHGHRRDGGPPPAHAVHRRVCPQAAHLRARREARGQAADGAARRARRDDRTRSTLLPRARVRAGGRDHAAVRHRGPRAQVHAEPRGLHLAAALRAAAAARQVGVFAAAPPHVLDGRPRCPQRDARTARRGACGRRGRCCCGHDQRCAAAPRSAARAARGWPARRGSRAARPACTLRPARAAAPEHAPLQRRRRRRQ